MPINYVPPDREAILAECIASSEKWTKKPGRNLIMLLDGTGNILGNHQDTNVVKLLRLLQKNTVDDGNPPTQIVYYDPGVGTVNEFPADGIPAKVASIFRRFRGLAFGSGAFLNLTQAYEFLVGNYRDGDRIFVFGFSRGAFTARAVGGMLNMYGLIQPAGLPLLQTMVRAYFALDDSQKKIKNSAIKKSLKAVDKTRKEFANDIIENFSLGRTPLVHFTGVWDSVETIGSGFFHGVSITNTRDFDKKRFVHVRHALSLHETRCKYLPRRYDPPHFSAEEKQYRSFDERWFRGVHSDVGGSYRRDGLSNITLNWMINEATSNGLRIDGGVVEAGNSSEPMHDQTYESPYWAWTGLNSRQRKKGDVIDLSALPVEHAVPASQESRSSMLMRYLGIGLAVFTAGLYCYMAYEACWLKSIPFAYKLLAPWHIDLGTACIDAKKLPYSQLFDWLLLASFAAWLAYPIAWALRRLTAREIPQGKSLAWLPRNAQWLMLGWVIAGIVANMGTYWIGHHPWLVTVATAIQLLCFALLAWVVAAGFALHKH